MKKRIDGFTLIELLIALVIIGILASVAVPSYQTFVMEGRRTDATGILLKARMLQEQWRATHTTYTSTIGAGGLGLDATSPQGYYSISIDAINTDANGYRVVATAIGSQASDTSCSTIVVDESGPDTSTAQKRDCWNL